MKTPAERGRIGAWAYEARQDADLSVEEVQERLTRAGHQVTTATLRGVESGSKQPSRRLLRSLATVYGTPAPGEVEEPAVPDSQALISAMTAALLAQTQALTDIRVELSEMRATMTTARNAALSERQAQMKVLAGLGDALDELLARGDTGARAVGPVSGH